MDEAERLLWMFKQVHGIVSGKCDVEVEYDNDNCNPIGCIMIKNSEVVLRASKVDLLFDYITKDL